MSEKENHNCFFLKRIESAEATSQNSFLLKKNGKEEFNVFNIIEIIKSKKRKEFENLILEEKDFYLFFKSIKSQIECYFNVDLTLLNSGEVNNFITNDSLSIFDYISNLNIKIKKNNSQEILNLKDFFVFENISNNFNTNKKFKFFFKETMLNNIIYKEGCVKTYSENFYFNSILFSLLFYGDGENKKQNIFFEVFKNNYFLSNGWERYKYKYFDLINTIQKNQKNEQSKEKKYFIKSFKNIEKILQKENKKTFSNIKFLLVNNSLKLEHFISIIKLTKKSSNKVVFYDNDIQIITGKFLENMDNENCKLTFSLNHLFPERFYCVEKEDDFFTNQFLFKSIFYFGEKEYLKKLFNFKREEDLYSYFFEKIEGKKNNFSFIHGNFNLNKKTIGCFNLVEGFSLYPRIKWFFENFWVKKCYPNLDFEEYKKLLDECVVEKNENFKDKIENYLMKKEIRFEGGTKKITRF